MQFNIEAIKNNEELCKQIINEIEKSCKCIKCKKKALGKYIFDSNINSYQCAKCGKEQIVSLEEMYNNSKKIKLKLELKKYICNDM